jgi:anti-repressor protein
MQQLIKITEQKGQKIVSARELYKFLGATERFSNWIERQFQYGFEENIDYVGCKEFNTLANQELEDYALTLDTAKEISMLQKSEKGKQARQYFIQCEKELNKPQLPQNYIGALEALLVSEKEKEVLQKQINRQSAKIEFIDRVLDTEEKIDIGQCAKILELPFGRNTLFKQLREQGIFFKSKNEPKQMYVEKGYFQLKEKWIDRNENESFMVLKVLVTQRGLGFLSTLFKSEQQLKITAKLN